MGVSRRRPSCGWIRSTVACESAKIDPVLEVGRHRNEVGPTRSNIAEFASELAPPRLAALAPEMAKLARTWPISPKSNDVGQTWKVAESVLLGPVSPDNLCRRCPEGRGCASGPLQAGSVAKCWTSPATPPPPEPKEGGVIGPGCRESASSRRLKAPGAPAVVRQRIDGSVLGRRCSCIRGVGCL